MKIIIIVIFNLIVIVKYYVYIDWIFQEVIAYPVLLACFEKSRHITNMLHVTFISIVLSSINCPNSAPVKQSFVYAWAKDTWGD